MTKPYRIGCIGVGGYAQHMLEQLDQKISRDRAVIGAVDVSMSQPADRLVPVLERHGTASVQGVQALMDFRGLDVVMVPTSIDSHLPYTKMALERGLHVHCQKPVTGTIDDALAMIEARDQAGKVVAIGFQDHYSTTTQWAKQKIINGTIGKIQRVRLYALWPRADSYYQRNNWAAAIQRDGKWLLDSPAHNALAHQLNLAMYLSAAGDDIYSYNHATGVEAELYRARDIENCDTCTMRYTTEAGCDVLILLTHATAPFAHPTVEYIGERGIVRLTNMNHAELEIAGKIVETRDHGPRDPIGPMLDNFLDRLDGKVSRVMCEIEDGMEVTRMVNAAQQATAVQTIGPAYVERVQRGPEDGCVNHVRDIDVIFKRCFDQFKLPSELGDVPWAAAGGKLDMRGYKHFAGVPVVN